MAKKIEKVDKEHVLLEVTVNGETIARSVRGGRRLIDFLRDDLQLTGTKEGCGEGRCGSCTIILNGTAILSCLTPMEKSNGGEMITIEGVGSPTRLHPLQQTMIAEDGVQCGMCTPGMIMMAIELLSRNPHPTRDEIIEGIAGNLCRCTGYQKIIAAIERAGSSMAGSTQ